MRRSPARSRRRWPALALLFAATLLFQVVWAPSASAGTLSGVFHSPSGYDELYGAAPTERAPRDPMAGQAVTLNATTWPVSSSQTDWITWTRNGVNQTPIGASFAYNSGNNSYWTLGMGSFARGDQISYTVRANVDGGGERTSGFDLVEDDGTTVTYQAGAKRSTAISQQRSGSIASVTIAAASAPTPVRRAAGPTWWSWSPTPRRPR